MNETIKAIAQRYSCRNFKPDPVSNEVLKQIALAGVQAPSAHNRQPWRIMVVTDPKLLKDIEDEALAGLQRQEDQANYNYIMKRGGQVFYGAPAVIIVAIDAKWNSAAFLDCGIVGQNMVIAATSLGIDTVYCGFINHAFRGPCAEEFKTRLGFPEGYVLGCSVLLGYAEKTKAPHVPDLDKITFFK